MCDSVPLQMRLATVGAFVHSAETDGFRSGPRRASIERIFCAKPVRCSSNLILYHTFLASETASDWIDPGFLLDHSLGPDSSQLPAKAYICEWGAGGQTPVDKYDGCSYYFLKSARHIRIRPQ